MTSILCVVEFDNYPQEVVARAIWLAKAKDCSLHLLVCDPVTDYLGESYVYLLESQHIAESIRVQQEAALDAMLADIESRGIAVEISRSTDRHVANLVRREAAARKPEFVLKGTHYHDPSERASLRDTDWDLIRELEYPLWFVKPGEWKEKPLIVAAVDPVHSHDKPAHLDQRIVEFARDLATKFRGVLDVVHTYQSIEEIGTRATWSFKPVKLSVEDLDRKIRNEHRLALDALIEQCDLDPERTHMLPGRADEILPSYAMANDASLVVMGALARGRIKQRMVGSTAARALDRVPCDVLVAHAHQKS
ncbi:MAG: universal stress protein [Woeseiaceae bacterium]|nr:universal stress protein [Woeseiaceae bacterium]